MKKIAFAGKMGSGKSTIVDNLMQKYKSIKLSFATPLKEDVIKYNLTPDGKIDKFRDRELLQSYGQLRRGEIEKFNHGKFLLFNVDTSQDYKKTFIAKENSRGVISKTNPKSIGKYYDNYWVDLLLDKVDKITSNLISWNFLEYIFIDDVRRVNEAKALQGKGFKIIKIEVSEKLRCERLMQKDGGYNLELMNNISESDIDNIKADYILHNDKPIDLIIKELLHFI